MAPKAKAKGAPKAPARPRAKGKAKARAKARVRGRGGALRRPASRGDQGGEAAPAPAELWDRGQELDAGEVPLKKLGAGVKVVAPKASYYLQECQVAFVVRGIEVKDDEAYLQAQVLGTTHEGLLKHHSGAPTTAYRLHLCGKGCNREEVSDSLIHCSRVRRMATIEKEPGWVNNLEKVVPAEGEDDLSELRKREQMRAPGEDIPDLGGGEKRKDKKKLKEKKKKKDRKEKEKKAERIPSSSSSEVDVKMDGSRPMQAATKSLSALFKGTGLDPKERVRRRVSQKARKVVRKKGKTEDSSEGSGSSSSSEEPPPEMDQETVFQQASKVRLVAAGCPGALACQALSQMRALLLSEIGSADKPGTLRPCAVAYYRQQLAKRASGAAQRELLSIAATVDLMMGGNAAGAMDLLLQRLKSCESTLAGTHWSVSQKLEILPQENTTLTPLPEMGEARRDVYQESKMRWLSSQPEGRGMASGPKGTGKNKAEGKDNQKGGGKDRRWGKGPNPKGDAAKKKEEGTGKA